jgi:hypothetical protein
MLINTILLLLLEKSGEIILELLLEKLWQWVLSERNLKHLLNSLKLQILLLYLDWVLLKSPIKSLPNTKTRLLQESGHEVVSPLVTQGEANGGSNRNRTSAESNSARDCQSGRTTGFIP